VHLRFEPIRAFTRKQDGKSRVVTAKDRPGYHNRPSLGVFELWTTDAGLVESLVVPASPDAAAAAGAGFRPTALMERVSVYVEGVPDQSRSRVAEDVTGKAAGIRSAIDELVREGYVSQTPDGKAQRLRVSARIGRLTTR
jgi:hypothetical protein